VGLFSAGQPNSIFSPRRRRAIHRDVVDWMDARSRSFASRRGGAPRSPLVGTALVWAVMVAAVDAASMPSTDGGSAIAAVTSGRRLAMSSCVTPAASPPLGPDDTLVFGSFATAGRTCIALRQPGRAARRDC